jgi:hypothetical protein
MENYSNNTKNENLIMLIMAAAIMLFNLIGFIVVYFVWKEYSRGDSCRCCERLGF